MLSESSQVSKQSDAFVNPFFPLDVPLGQIKHTNRSVEVLRCLDMYVGVSIMSIGVFENHSVI